MNIRPALAIVSIGVALGLLTGCADRSSEPAEPPPSSVVGEEPSVDPSPTSGSTSATPTAPGDSSPGPTAAEPAEDPGDEPQYHLLSMGRLGPIEVGEPIATYVEQGYVEWGDSREQCAYWEMRGPYEGSGEIYAGREDQVMVVGGVDVRVRTAEGVGPGSTVGDVRAAYGEKLKYDWLRENGAAPVGIWFTEGEHQIVFLIDRAHLNDRPVDPAGIPDVAKVTYAYTSTADSAELRTGPPASTC